MAQVVIDTHTCAVCTKRISPRMLMCWPHWQMVPEDLRRAVTKSWSDLNFGSFRNTKGALGVYMAARQAAIYAVQPTAPTTPTGEPHES
jgi:hypothetical protein